MKLTQHARERMIEMGLDKGDLARTLRDPEIMIEGNHHKDKHGRLTARHREDGTVRHFVRDDHVVVAELTKPENPRVITVLVRTRELYQRQEALA